MSESIESDGDRIDEFVTRTRDRIGDPIVEGPPWNTGVNSDQSKIFLNGLGDVNPRWDPETVGDEVHPTFLTSVRYPQLHGEPMSVPMSSFVSDFEYRWQEPITLGDEIDATAVIDDVFEKERDDRRYVFVVSDTTYEVGDTLIAEATATQIFVSETESNFEDRDIYEYSDSELADIESVYEDELNRLSSVPESPDPENIAVGDDIPRIVRGPLTIADMVCWQSAAPPTYGSSIVNYRQRKNSPHNTVINPETGWIQKSSHQHEDVWLCQQRGIPLPFANGVNLYAWTTIPVTNWLGEAGKLRRHKGYIKKPLLYSDLFTVDATITDKQRTDGEWIISLEWEGTNQMDETVLDGDSEVALPTSG